MMHIPLFANPTLPKWQLIIIAAVLHFATGALQDAGAAEEADWNIQVLMGLLAQNKGGHATYTENKFISMLDGPLASSGVLVFTPPDHLEKNSLKPKKESFILDGDTVSINQNQQKHVVHLQDYPRIAAFIDSIRGTLAGDQMSLEKSYRLDLNGTSHQWTLTLWPVVAELTDIIHNIKVQGKLGQVHSIEIKQVDGDYSIMTINNLKTL